MREDNDIVTPRGDNGSFQLLTMLKYFVALEKKTDLLRRHRRFKLERVSQVMKWGRGEEGEEGRQLDPLIEERWSSATLRVLSSMPSRTIGRSRGAIISQYCNKTMKLRRRRQSRPSIKDFSRSARPSIRGYGEGSTLHSQIPCCSQLKYNIINTLLFFNVFLFLVTVLFLALPQAVHPPRLTQGHVAFSGLELLTGGPSHSPSKRTMETDCGVKLSYNMPLAYFFTIGGAFFITCIILVYSMSKSFGQSFRIDKSHGILAMKVFTSWDFKVIKKTSVKLRSENICTQLKDLQYDLVSPKGAPLPKGKPSFSPAIVVSSSPPAPRASSTLCRDGGVRLPPAYTPTSPSRTKFKVAARICFHWLGAGSSDPKSIGCREGNIPFQHSHSVPTLGVLFTPLLPAVQIIKLLLLFYMKKTSVMMNCQSPRKPYRASQMTTIFITLLCFPSFLGAAVCVTYTMWSIRPSESCGPFRSLSTMFQSGKLWVKELGRHNPNLAWLAWAHSYIVENPLFLFLAAGIFLVVIYFNTQVVDGQRKIISLLQEQIENEGEDKKFLITRLQALHQQKPPFSPRRLTSQASQDSNG
ncbi:unnamed protein product [Coregonus sp. 'balchen']|nr:unnamed protein product [Coregonus sp. 'balchen']